MRAIGRFFRTILILAVILIGGAIAYALSGHYDVSVGSGHTPVTQWYLDTVRDRSINRRAADMSVPNLNDADMIEAGAGGYEQACAGCHGRPGREPSQNFDPRPPALTRGRPDPAQAFWVTRNGIKMSAMPRRSEEQLADEDIWAMVAFLQVASAMTEGEYREMVERALAEPEPEPEIEPESEMIPDDEEDPDDYGEEPAEEDEYEDEEENGDY